jgi:hypothetical protein
MSKSCPKNILPITPSECLGNSREKINNNFNILKEAVCTLTAGISSITDRMKFLPPVGTIIRFWGDITPGGPNFDNTGQGKIIATNNQDLSPWALCNGNNGTPNLLSRFIVGAGNLYDQAYPTGTMGPLFNSSASLQFSAVKLTIPEMAKHDHSIIDGLGNGGHNHPLTIQDHDHSYTDAYSKNDEAGADSSAWVWLIPIPPLPLLPPLPITLFFPNQETGVKKKASSVTRNVVPHKSNLAPTTSNDTTGITAQLEGGGKTHENRPPYQALGFIMRIV